MREWRAALRSLSRRRGLSATIVVTLALGIGANSAIFSAVDAVLLKPLPYPEPDRLVRLYELNLSRPGATQLVAPTRIEAWHEANRTLDGIAGSYFENLTETVGSVPERVEAMRTSPRFFAVLGVPPALGRWPTLEEEQAGGPKVVVLSDAVWRSRFNADPAVIGRTWRIGGGTPTIIAVMPPKMRYPTAATQAWLPVQAPQRLLEARQARFYTAFARLKPGVTLEQARDDLDAIQSRLGEQYPETDKGWGASLVPLKEEQVAGVRRSLWILLAAVGLVLFAACGNVACLLLADATRREHEMAVRLAIGAQRRQIVKQLLVEGSVLAAMGAAAGLFVAYWATRALATMTTVLPVDNDLRIDGRLVVFTLALGVLSTVLFALAPALQAAGRRPADALARGGRAQAGGRHLLQRCLVGVQVGLALVLLVGAGLLMRSFARLQAIDPGLVAENVVTFRMTASWSERLEAVEQRQARTVARLEEIPGVRAAAFTQLLPIDGDYPPQEFFITGRDPGEKTFAHGRMVSAGYFRTLGIPMLEGGTCDAMPTRPSRMKAIVSESFVKRFFANDTALGRHLRTVSMPAGETMEIVGIVRDVRERGITKAPEPILYHCGFNGYWPDMFYMASLDPSRPAGIPALRAALGEIEPSRAMYSIRPLTEVIRESMAQARFNTTLLALFAATALGLAAMGLYGVLSQLVAARRREIGVRLALGAAPARIVRSVAAQAATVTAAGIVAGLLAAAAAARFMSALVYDVPTHDPLTFALVPALLAIVAAVAALIPARRAARVDPVETLRG